VSAGAAFDRLAFRYDEVWTESPVGRAQRATVWRELDVLFRRGDCVLDIGCGTGEDAAHLTARGVMVRAIDASPAMVEQASRRGGFAVSVGCAEKLGAACGSYDGAIANFGVLNCIEDLPAFAAQLAQHVRPGGRVAICVMGRFCAWETLYYAGRLQFRKAFRRLGRNVTWSGVRLQYPTVRQVRSSFAPGFRLLAWRGVGLVVPPSYIALPHWLVRLAAVPDRMFGAFPLFRGLADHRLLILVRE